MTADYATAPERSPDLFSRAVAILPYLLLTILAYCVIIQIAPHLELAPRVDSSVYLYVGDRILDGAVPYKDVWDHKGPLIYYINALGLAISDESRWGVWSLELIAVIFTALISFALFRRAFGAWPAFFASALFVLELRLVLDKGNMTEEFALPFQFLLLWLIWRAADTRRPVSFFAIGAVAALCFLLRPNIIGIPLAFGLIQLWQAVTERSEEAKRCILIMVVGGLSILGIVAVYFLLARALPQLWDAIIYFNLLHDAGKEGSRWGAVTAGFENLPVATTLGVAGWVLALLWQRSRKDRFSPIGILALMILIGLPLEMALSSLTGFYFTHYYMSWLPILALSAGFGMHYISTQVRRWGKGWPEPNRMARALALILTFLLILPPTRELLPEAQASAKQIWELQTYPEVDPSTRAWWPVVRYAAENLRPEQPLLVLGHEVKINWLAGRHPPIPFVYQTPLLNEKYMSAEKAEELIAEMEADPPTIIDTGPPGGFMPSLNTPLNEIPEDLRPLYKYFQENYVYSGTFKEIEWDLYLYHGEGEPIEQ